MEGQPVMNFLTASQWSPYVAGAGIGVLSCLSFLLCNKPLACSTSFSRTSGMIELLFRRKAFKREYYSKFKPEIEWQWMLVAGVFAGALISSILSGEFSLQAVPLLWAQSFGNGWVLRFVVAFLGGLLMGLGSRWAGGCTSGHGISGSLQLTLSSWMAVVVFFVFAILFAHLLFTLSGQVI